MSGWDDEWDLSDTPVNPDNAQMIEYYVNVLKQFQLQIVDSQNYQKINQSLLLHDFASVRAYYDERPSLVSQTLNDVKRMSYTVVDRNGVETTERCAIIRLVESDNSYIWRLTNQSIFAQVATELHELLHHTELAVCVTTLSSQFRVDLSRQCFHAEALFAIGTLCDISEKVQLGTLNAEIDVDIARNSLRQCVQTPSLRVVFDDELHHIAVGLARHNAVMRSQDMEMPSTRVQPATSFLGTLQSGVTGLLHRAPAVVGVVIPTPRSVPDTPTAAVTSAKQTQTQGRARGSWFGYVRGLVPSATATSETPTRLYRTDSEIELDSMAGN